MCAEDCHAWRPGFVPSLKSQIKFHCGKGEPRLRINQNSIDTGKLPLSAGLSQMLFCHCSGIGTAPWDFAGSTDKKRSLSLDIPPAHFDRYRIWRSGIRIYWKVLSQYRPMRFLCSFLYPHKLSDVYQVTGFVLQFISHYNTQKRKKEQSIRYY